MEQRIAALVKNAAMLWDFSRYSGAVSTSYKQCIRDMAHEGRQAPLSPDQVEVEMRTRVAECSLSFSYASDLETVIDLYRRGFIHGFDGYRALRHVAPDKQTSIWYGNLCWGDREAEDLSSTLQYAQQHCSMTDGVLEIDITGNTIGESGLDALRRVPLTKVLFVDQLDSSSTRVQGGRCAMHYEASDDCTEAWRLRRTATRRQYDPRSRELKFVVVVG
jgi:hypothetical protein